MIMAGKLKPVDDSPFCDPAYLRRIDPRWMPGPAPKYFWEDLQHRRDFLLWLGHRLGYRCFADFYQLELKAAFKNHGGAGLKKYWDELALRAVTECFPMYDWKPWLFRMAPWGFWDSFANRRSYLDWLGSELGFRKAEDWYRIQSNDFRNRCGWPLLNCYASLYDLMREYMPQLDWDRVDVRQPISVEDVLAWADDHYARHDAWPTSHSGEIPGTEQNWTSINACFQNGCRGLTCGGSLATFLEKHRGVRVGKGPPDLSEAQILAWADLHFAAHKKWPTEDSGAIPETREIWEHVSNALRRGRRGLRGGSSLAQLLAERRGARNRQALPRLNQKLILAWAEAHYEAVGQWPHAHAGPIIQSPGDTWPGVNKALRDGLRGLPGGSSLAILLARRRGVRNRLSPPPFTERRILAWAKAYKKATGRSPTKKDGPIANSPADTWIAADRALRIGQRGLPGGSSLIKLLRKNDPPQGVACRSGVSSSQII
jgi:hypothetical protein